MTSRTRPHNRFATLLPLIAIPVVASSLVEQFDGISDFVRGLVTGASIALLLGFCVYEGIVLGASKSGADHRRLDELDPLGGLPRDEDGQR